MIHDHRICALGEGPLWHPVREQLFWFDILGGRLLSQGDKGPLEWQFPENVSAAGWIGRDEFLIASETALFRFNIETGIRTHVIALEADNAVTRSNDGRADPFGGFWIGTMGKNSEKGVGSIYRWYQGELRRLYTDLSIPNSICFDPAGGFAHFTGGDNRVMKVVLDAQGWPDGEPVVFLDLTGTISEPDGAVIDASGILWLAEWGAARVAAYAPDGRFLRAVKFDAPQTSCPAFGGPDLTTLFCTSALVGLDPATHPNSGKTFSALNIARGQSEHMVIL